MSPHESPWFSWEGVGGETKEVMGAYLGVFVFPRGSGDSICVWPCNLLHAFLKGSDSQAFRCMRRWLTRLRNRASKTRCFKWQTLGCCCFARRTRSKQMFAIKNGLQTRYKGKMEHHLYNHHQILRYTSKWSCQKHDDLWATDVISRLSYSQWWWWSRIWFLFSTFFTALGSCSKSCWILRGTSYASSCLPVRVCSLRFKPDRSWSVYDIDLTIDVNG